MNSMPDRDDPGKCPSCNQNLSPWFDDTYGNDKLTCCNNHDCLLYHDRCANNFTSGDLHILRDLDYIFSYANAGIELRKMCRIIGGCGGELHAVPTKSIQKFDEDTKADYL